MTMIDDELDSQVLDQELTATDDVEDVVASAETEGSDESSPQDKPDPQLERLRRRLTQAGRRAATAEQAASQTQAELAQTRVQVQQLEQKLAAVGKSVSDEQARRTQEYLDSLPPERRAIAENQILQKRLEQLERRLAGTGQPTTQTQAPAHRQQPPQQPHLGTQEAVNYMKQRSQEILDEVFEQTGIELDGTEDELNWDNEQAFVISASTLARARMKQGGTVAKKTRQVDDEEEQTTPRPANRPMSPRANAPTRRRAPATPEDFNRVLGAYDSSKGPKAARRELEKLRSR